MRQAKLAFVSFLYRIFVHSGYRVRVATDHKVERAILFRILWEYLRCDGTMAGPRAAAELIET